MIESYYWREKLRDELKWLRKKQTYKRWSEKQMVLYERQLILVAFQIRSLLDRPKIAREYTSTKLEVTKYNKVDSEPLTRYNIGDFYELFSMDQPISTFLSAPQVCNQLIHYYLMCATSLVPKSFSHLLVISDYKRNQYLFEIDIYKLLDFFELFSIEESGLTQSGRSVKLTWNEKKQDYDYIDDIDLDSSFGF